MDAELLKETINTLVFLLPVLGLVWKGAKLTSRLETLETDVKEMAKKIEQERLSTDTSIASIISTLTEIQKSLVRVETKLDIEDKEIKK